METFVISSYGLILSGIIKRLCRQLRRSMRPFPSNHAPYGFWQRHQVIDTLAVHESCVSYHLGAVRNFPVQQDAGCAFPRQDNEFAVPPRLLRRSRYLEPAGGNHRICQRTPITDDAPNSESGARPRVLPSAVGVERAVLPISRNFIVIGNAIVRFSLTPGLRGFGGFRPPSASDNFKLS
jgi:hypothetical protein